MSSSTPSSNTAKLDRILADAQRDREMGYRDKALKMYPTSAAAAPVSSPASA